MGPFSMGGYAVAGLVNGEMLPVALPDERMKPRAWLACFYRQATPGPPGPRAPAPPGGSVLYKSERPPAVIVQSEVGGEE